MISDFTLEIFSIFVIAWMFTFSRSRRIATVLGIVWIVSLLFAFVIYGKDKPLGDFAYVSLVGSAILGAVFLILAIPGLLVSFRNKNKKCSVCPNIAKDIVIKDNDGEDCCRMHAMEKFRQAFLESPHLLIVFHPELDRKYCGGMYPFFPITDLGGYNFKKEAEDNMQRVLGLVTGMCQDCGIRLAQVAYFPKGLVQYNRSGPVLEKVEATPKLLCKECALELIVSDIANHPEPLNDNGLYLPYKGPGVYVNTFM